MSSHDQPSHEARTFDSREAAIAYLQSLPVAPGSIIILTPPPKK